MKAIVCDEFAPVEQLSYREVEDPQPSEGEVRIVIKAIGVNYPDALLVQGEYQARPERPFTPGSEFAGVVEAVSDDVSTFKPGDRVMGLSPNYGAYAEKICCPVNRLQRLPEDMSFEAAAGLTLAHGTAHYALKQRADLQPGEVLLVLGAAGGTGLAAVQLGKAMGAQVIAACSSQDKLDLAKSQGADLLINYQDRNLKDEIKRLTAGKGVDVVYDPVGGQLFDLAARCMAPKGRLLVIGFASGTIPSLPANLALVKEFSMVGVFWGAFTRREPQVFAENMQELFAWYQAGKVSLHQDACLPLKQAPVALRRMLDRQVKGKLLLQP